MSIRIGSKSSGILGVLLATFVAAPSYASYTICERGKVKALKVWGNSPSSFAVSSGMSTAAELDKSRLQPNLYGTNIRATDYERWNNMYNSIKMAHATDSYIWISSSDSTCAGGQDKFRIWVCKTEYDCRD